MECKEPNKYFVLKQSDIDEFFEPFVTERGVFTKMTSKGEKLRGAMDEIINGIEDIRKNKGKPRTNKYIVCNQDEPYADKIWKTILDGEHAKREQ